ncbi:Receptor-like serine/threonine-protein kinase [Heracleum sosnowskyi]|uniref:Receptor-like serine/threonine-protein kinase n=1 Tax=Heracleum sosnowskyi TaxID=360622 RepID=A0AAD8JF77_9APIA|nr:Receptor-like serine/threonine-protein kinase [Heracleum sosnowskyi]
MVPATKPDSLQLRIIVMFLYIFSNLKFSTGLDTLSPGQPLSGNQTLISQGQKFELGFFSPGNSTNSYVGIWYYDILDDKTVVWVANRDSPIPHISNNSRLVLGKDGSLELFYTDFAVIWATNSSVANKGVLLDDGNFILSDGLNVLWQSFDYPTDTWLPGAKLGNIESLILTSWKYPDDPAPGIYSFGMNPKSDPELFIWKNSSQIVWRSGVWNGYHFDSFLTGQTNFSYIEDDQAKYFTYNMSKSFTSRYVMTYSGQIRQLVRAKNQNWSIYNTQPADSCSIFGFCGPNGVCSIDSSPPCGCLNGFIPGSPYQWQSADWTGGCIRTKPLQCSNIEFINTPGVSMPANSQYLKSESGQVCQYACLANCSCNAYAYNDGRCSLWIGDLLDTRKTVGDPNSQENLYIRSSEVLLASKKSKKQSKVLVAVFITIPLLICISVTYILYWRVWRRKHNKKEVGETGENIFYLNLEISSKQEADSDSITTSSPVGGEHGEGGFGPVYKGNLFGGKSVAVKRLSKRSGQGLAELRNETVLIAKLQHRNLVRLLGCCIDQDEKILVYEYMSNKSLDQFIFDPSKQSLLDWRRRVHIIDGITQGLLYLHQHSRLRIIHRDLKASNILLDDDLNPKISDFGMARIFGGDELQANTNRIVGTYGYMSPEYAMEGLFSIKSDVFAFGVLLLEIISGRKNTGFRNSDCLSLLAYAWELWKADRVLELVDSNLDIPSSFLPLRFIQVGLLCVQESPADRPTMSDVLLMFGNEHIQLVSPERPAFTSGGSLGSGIEKGGNFSMNILTASVMDGR